MTRTDFGYLRDGFEELGQYIVDSLANGLSLEYKRTIAGVHFHKSIIFKETRDTASMKP